MASARQRFDCIMPYLTAKHPKLAAIFVDFCAEFLLRPGKFAPGIALLVPDNKVIDEIERGMNSASEAEYSKAFDTLCALVMRQNLQSGADWKKEPVSDSRKPMSFVVEVKSATGNKVELESGSCEKDAGFHPHNDRPISVWKLTGKPPMGTTHAAPPKRVVKSKAGGHQFSADDTESKALLNAVISESARHKSDPAAVTACFTKPVAQAVLWLIDNSPADAAAVIPLLNNTIADFFIVFDPLCKGPHLLNLKQWYESDKVAPHDYDARVEAFIAGHADPCAFYKNRSQVLEAVSLAREQCVGTGKSSIEAIINFNMTLASENRIGDCKNVFPEVLHAYLSASPYRLLVWTDMRFLVWHTMSMVEPSALASDFPDLLASIINMTIADASDYEARLGLFNSARASRTLAQAELRGALLRFVYSSLGPVYIRQTHSERAGASKRLAVCMGAPIVDETSVKMVDLEHALAASGLDAESIQSIRARLASRA